MLISDLSLRFFSTGSLLGDQDHRFLCKPYNTVFSHYSIFVCKCEIKLHDALLDSIDRFEILSFALLREQAIFFPSEILSFVLLIGYMRNQCKLYSLTFPGINLKNYEKHILMWLSFESCIVCALA